ncbi:adenylate/guanylate cyclase domain-containing protein [Roseateles oligotrophus]|uniref:AAA family ATPase n=1 Tax=Roseateles oligotrophus TaxID=1769250 RepID=A0ABT2YKD3_9BURK|nr:adenylate/guanylate cyclase domain-containing protein [Roseateles oligotrophus]MCV2370426.1 AAA family ATPase [Roseateles oligotrophus]
MPMINPTDQVPVSHAMGERRNLTVLFADLSESTRLADAMEAEHYAIMLRELRALYQGVVPRHGGTVVRIQGDGMLAIFGHPEMREDDGRRATEAALELHQQVRLMRPPSGSGQWPHGQELSLHSGIHAGMVLIEEGDAVRGRFDLLGNTPNFAARLSDEAEVDEILVSEETLGLQSHYFQTSERRVVQLKGRSTALAVYAIKGRSTIGRRFEASQQRGLAPFVGRTAELLMLDQALAAAIQGRPGWVSIRANAGVGKTRLTEEFLRRAALKDCKIQRGYCESYLSAEPLQPYLQMLRILVSQGMAEAEPLLSAAPPLRQSGLLHLLAGLTRQAPQLIFIDDLQWADDASLLLLHRLYALAVKQKLPLLLLTATRPQEAGLADSGAAMLELQPFNTVEAELAIVQLLPNTDPFIALDIQRHAGGNPLFIEELCHAIKYEQAGRRALSRPRVDSAGQAWLSALTLSRVARLAPEQAALLRAAAVIGNIIPAWLMQRLTGCSEQDTAVLGLAEHDFVYPDRRAGFFRFKHGLTRDVVYESIGWHERQAMHRHIAAELRSQAHDTPRQATDELLGYHEAAAGQWAEAAVHAERAGDQALAASALDRAKKQYRAALAALENLPEGSPIGTRWVSIAQRFGVACVFDASRADLRVLQHAVQLAEKIGDATLIARADYWLGYASYALGEVRAGLLHCASGLAAAQCNGEENVALIAQLHGAQGQLLAAAAAYPEALTRLDEAIVFLRALRQTTAPPTRPAVGLAYSLACRAYVLGDQGHFAAAHACFEEALSIIQGSNHAVEASVQGWRAAVYLWQGDWAQAQQAAAQAHRIGGLVRSLFTYSMGHAAGAYAAWQIERSAASAQSLQDAATWLAPRGGGLFSSLIHGWLADVLAEQGDVGGARRQIALALRRGRQRDWIGVAMAYRAAARIAAAAADAQRAQRYLDAAQAVADLRGSAHESACNRLLAAELALGQGEPAQALLARAAEAFEELDMAWHLQRSRRLMATV